MPNKFPRLESNDTFTCPGAATFASTVDVTGALTASGGITGDITGNASGTAATVTGAAQTAITSLGTLTALQVDNINLNGSAISITAAAAEHGAGAIGTAVAPATYRWTENGVIITQIKVDLTGLDSSGTENDVIGLSTGGAAYIGRNVVATNGVIFRVEMSCIELPVTGDADILLVAGSAADEAFDDTVANTATLCDSTGDFVAGETIVNNAPAITANYYYYLTQGSTDDATYTGGQIIITFYGHALLA